MIDRTELDEISSKVEELKRLAEELYERSEDFPAINRNTDRILASVEMLRLNLERGEESLQ